MRIALVIKTTHGGLWTVPQIHELRARGHEVTVVLPTGDGRLRRVLDAHGIPVVESGFSFGFRPRLATLRGLLALRRQLVAIAPDVVFYHLYASALAARLAGAGLEAARVHMVAGPLYLESPWIRAAERLLVKLDTVTICGSAFTADAYRRLGRTAEEAPTISYGVDTTHFRPLDEQTARSYRAEIGAGESTFVVVMVAFVYAPKRAVHAGHGVKGHTVLLEAWTTFHRRHPDSRLVVVGGGIDDAGARYRETLASRYDATDHGITWVATADDVRRYYAAADLSVSPSLSENHGAALEAGAMGVPSIVSDAGALPETVGPETGWVVPRGGVATLGSALEAAHGEHVAGNLGARGRRSREFVQRTFERSRSSAAVADVIESIRHVPVGPRRYSVFCEARFGAGPEGRWAGTDVTNGWDRYLRHSNGVDVVARADPRAGTGTVPLPGELRLVPTPYYVGPRQLVAHAVPLARSVARAVRDADAIILRLPGVVGSIAALACLLLRRRYAVEVVGDPREVLAGGALGPGGRLMASAAASYTRWAVRRADTALYVTTKRLQSCYPPGPRSTASGVSDVVMGADAYVAHGRRWAPGRARIVALGSQEYNSKGHDVLLRAVRRMLDSGVDVDAVIIGGGRLHDEYRALATSLGIGGRVSLVGAVNDRTRIVAMLDSATVFAMPSRTEGLPRALVEAMARGLPAVATDVGGIPELLDAGCLVPAGDDRALADALAALTRDPELWEEQSRRNLETASGFRVDDLRRKFDTWLQTVPAAAGTPPTDLKECHAEPPHHPRG